MPKDLVILAADKNIEYMLRGVLSRPQALNVEPLVCDFFIHPEHDPGCLLKGVSFLGSFVNIYSHALILFDREGCGQEKLERETLENNLEADLANSGWGNRASAIVLDPELEVWVWSDSPHVEVALGWKDKQPNLKSWLVDKGFLKAQDIKPDRPKEAMEVALREARKPRSSAIYQELARSVSFNRCSDLSFLKLRTTLENWFSQNRNN